MSLVQKLKSLSKTKKVILVLLAIFLLWFTFSLPSKLFNDPVSLVVNSREGKLLGARIAKDGQWRFPYNEQVSDKFKKCITTFEDKRFYSHIGVDVRAIARAIKLNLKKKDVVSGASTISMQAIRLSRKGKGRTYFEKVLEMFLALRLEIRYSKNEIMAFYASNAPFGANVVGLDAAAWKYYGRPASELTWAETATLAVLPNSPSLIHLGKNRAKLEQKRNFLLLKLHDQGYLNKEEYQLSLLEHLPDKPKALPNLAPHLIDKFLLETQNLNTEKRIQTTVKYRLQEQVNQEVMRYGMQLVRNGISNIGVIVLDIKNNEVLAYCGNTPPMQNSRDNSVDMIGANRSTGSILKPFLYAFSLEEGLILQNSLLEDVPSNYAGFTPKNHERSYEGVVKASDALSRSLNVPMVKLLHDFSQPKFYTKMKSIGMKTLTKDARHYGLSLILGGAETSLWDISAMYSGMVRSVEDFNRHRYYRKDCFESPQLILDTNRSYSFNQKSNYISASSAYQTLMAMNEVKRPGVEASWQNFVSSRKIAWKTGTSYGNRDAWAIGCTQDYVVAVWVGNADGEGRPEMTGTFTASPLLFNIYNLLPRSSNWFQEPVSDMESLEVCASSGYLAGVSCPKIIEQKNGKMARNGKVCPYCTTIHTDLDGKFLVNSNCYSPTDMQTKNVFSLPPTEEYYHSKINPFYERLPDLMAGCEGESESKAMELDYPKLKSNIYLPIVLDGTSGKAIFQLSHRNPETIVYWHLDDNFLGTTSSIHDMEISASAGEHTLTLTDEMGERLVRKFKVVSKHGTAGD
jgi:penicillin-binding protein 1C